MHLSEFDYHLPPELIAQEPLADRAASRMLVVYRNEGRWEDRAFRDLPAVSSRRAIAWCSTIRACFRRACSGIAPASMRCRSARTIRRGTNT